MKKLWVIALVLPLAISGFILFSSEADDPVTSMTVNQPTTPEVQTEITTTTPVTVPEGLDVATFAGGCFWCTEAVFQEQNGIDDAVSGYAGGQEVNPTYEQVYTNTTGHREAVQFFYDPDVISYDELLDVYFLSIDPTDEGGQFIDRGFSYTTAVFYHDDSQRKAAEDAIAALNKDDNLQGFPVVTKLLPFTTFYAAEEYHQDYYIKAPDQYDSYKSNSGREEFKATIWGEIQSQEYF